MPYFLVEYGKQINSLPLYTLYHKKSIYSTPFSAIHNFATFVFNTISSLFRPFYPTFIVYTYIIKDGKQNPTSPYSSTFISEKR